MRRADAEVPVDLCLFHVAEQLGSGLFLGVLGPGLVRGVKRCVLTWRRCTSTGIRAQGTMLSARQRKRWPGVVFHSGKAARILHNITRYALVTHALRTRYARVTHALLTRYSRVTDALLTRYSPVTRR